MDAQSSNYVLILQSYTVQVRVVRRDNGAKVDIPVANLVEEAKALLDDIQANLLKTAREKRDSCIEVIHTWDEFTTALNNKRLILAPWCDEEVLEDRLYLLSDLTASVMIFTTIEVGWEYRSPFVLVCLCVCVCHHSPWLIHKYNYFIKGCKF
jgi:hypothetical protein